MLLFMADTSPLPHRAAAARPERQHRRRTSATVANHFMAVTSCSSAVAASLVVSSHSILAYRTWALAAPRCASFSSCGIVSRELAALTRRLLPLTIVFRARRLRGAVKNECC
jgi:hypothetical protein